MDLPVIRMHPDREVVTVRKRESHRAVLVAVTEEVQDGQGVVFWRGGHAEARLKVPDHFLRRWLNTLEVLLPIPFPLLLGGTNGELGTFARCV